MADPCLRLVHPLGVPTVACDCRECVAERHWEKKIRTKARRSRLRAHAHMRAAISKGKRQRIYERDDHMCVECRASESLTLDHKIPLALGGTNADDNLQTMCAPCNEAKGSEWTA